MKNIETKKVKIEDPLKYIMGEQKLSPKPKKIIGYFVGDSNEIITNIADAIVKWASESRPELFILGDFAVKEKCDICGKETRSFFAGLFICPKCRREKRVPEPRIVYNGSRIIYHYNGDDLTYVIYYH